MRNKTTLLFGIHMHQPVDNFKEVISHAVNVCYAPFFEVLSRYPEFRFSVHCSGWLMQQIESDYPKLFKNIVELSNKGSIEFFGAGFYEPVLSAIPSQDRIAQIKKLSSEIEINFNQNPKGLWLSERVWDSSLVSDLHKSEIEYTLLDDYHFQSAGIDEDVLDGYYTTEEGGKSIGIFPISKKLRYALPFFSVERCIKIIKLYSREKDSAAVIFDDAEKFGMWPGTYAWVYEKGWLEKFIQTVLKDDEIKCEHYGKYFKEQKTRGIAYLPNVSYYEMGEWSLKADDAIALEILKNEMGEERYNEEGIKFLKGGIWKNFFVKYEESNRIHKRMLELSSMKEEIKNELFNENLYKLQTNDVMWHGVFGGLYLPNLRDNAYSYLIECEKLRYSGKTLISTDESEMDGYLKVKSVTPKYIFRFDSKYGGQLIEFDDLQKCFNWQNTLSRRKESYHERMLRPPSEKQMDKNDCFLDGIDTIHNSAHHINEEIKEALVYDWYIKNSFVDHISDKSATLENFRSCSFKEYGDFANQPFLYSKDSEAIVFEREGGVYLPQKYNTHLKKSYITKQNGFRFKIELATDSDYFFNYILELNLHFAEYEKVRVNGEKISVGAKKERMKSLEITDSYLDKKIIISLDREVDFLYYPLKTVSQSEQGFDLTTQSLSMAFVLPFSKNFSLEGVLEVEDV
ncbi:alpha-amylase/4-alpha-glucanotransferase domain-containing protein [Sulfurimonas sp. CS5]|uniref:alpha-amylase/4-alpha-glucanotransferase domain-containing protein n=1 Tax=Sulfurimonas sp. CS5 TaxID=3391145 RepID=UPI0039EA3DA2